METIVVKEDLGGQKGLSNSGLKMLAAVLMVLDHIHYFFEYTGKIPLLFSQVGRIAAPLFLFCLVEGFVHTSNRRRYFGKIYLISIFMGAVQFSFYNIGAGLVRVDGFFPQNQMLSSFVVLLVVLQGLEWCRDKRWRLGIPAVVIPILLPFIMSPFLQNVRTAFWANLLAFTFLPLHLMIVDGGTATLIAGIIFYVFRKSRIRQAVGFAAFVVLYDVLLICLMAPGLGIKGFFTEAYQWMEIFAVIPILCYNGTRGNGPRKFFYWFYPAHIYVLYGLSCVLWQASH